MAELFELLRFLALVAFFAALVACPPWLARRLARNRKAERVQSREARDALAAATERLQVLTEQVERLLAESGRDLRSYDAAEEVDRTPGRVAVPAS